MKKLIIILMMLIMALSVSATCIDNSGQYFQLSAQSGTIPNTILQGEDLAIPIIITNTGKAGTMTVECGMYLKDQVLSWYGGLAILNTNKPNCVPSETNVDTIELTLDQNERKIHTFHITAPQSDASKEYLLHCASFLNCYNTGCDTGQTSNYVDEIDLIGVNKAESCFDGLKNQDETDTDCGGTCKTCENGYRCLFDDDCTSNNCAGGICKEKGESNIDNGVIVAIVLLIISIIAFFIVRHPYVLLAIVISIIYLILQLSGVL